MDEITSRENDARFISRHFETSIFLEEPTHEETMRIHIESVYSCVSTSKLFRAFLRSTSHMPSSKFNGISDRVVGVRRFRPDRRRSLMVDSLTDPAELVLGERTSMPA